MDQSRHIESTLMQLLGRLVHIVGLMVAFALGIGTVAWLGSAWALAVAVVCAVVSLAFKPPIGVILMILFSGRRHADK